MRLARAGLAWPTSCRATSTFSSKDSRVPVNPPFAAGRYYRLARPRRTNTRFLRPMAIVKSRRQHCGTTCRCWCRCGSFGCLESMASAEALVRRAEAAIQAGQKTSLSQRQNGLTLTQIARAAHDGDVLSRQLFEEAGRHIGVALAGLINLLNPGLVIVGVGADGQNRGLV